MMKIKCVLVTEDEGKIFSVQRVDYVTSDINPETGKCFRFGKTDFIDGSEVTKKLEEKLA